MFSPQLEPNPNRVKRVERLESTNELAFTSYGVRIRVRFSNSQMREQVIECLPPEKEFASLEFVDRTYEPPMIRAGRENEDTRSTLIQIG